MMIFFFFSEALEKNSLAERTTGYVHPKLCFWLRVVSRFLSLRIAGVANIMTPEPQLMTTIIEQTRTAYP